MARLVQWFGLKGKPMPEFRDSFLQIFQAIRDLHCLGKKPAARSCGNCWRSAQEYDMNLMNPWVWFGGFFLAHMYSNCWTMLDADLSPDDFPVYIL